MAYVKRIEDDPRYRQALGMSIEVVANMLKFDHHLKRTGSRGGWAFEGPCPSQKCVGDPGNDDRFGLDITRQIWNCRKCDGGDQIHLVRAVLGCGFGEALTFLCGEPGVEIDPAEIERREKEYADNQSKREDENRRYRERMQKMGWRVWQEGLQAEGSLVRDYLELRGITKALFPELPRKVLRFHPELNYAVEKIDGDGFETIYTGPAMLAAMQGPDGRFFGVHRTWLDLDEPNGRLALEFMGQKLKTKKTLGSKKKSAIRLVKENCAPILVVGEGIETVLSAYVARPEWLADAAFWSGVDLYNMGGTRITRGKGNKFKGIPNLDNTDCLIPPQGTKRLIYLKDGDPGQETHAKLLAGLRRAMHYVPGLKGQIIEPREGLDFNDMLQAPLDDGIEF